MSVQLTRLKPPANNSGAYNKAEDYLLENMLGHKVSNSFVRSSEESEPLPKVYICSQCATKNAQKVERPTREQLKELIRFKPFTQIGKDFGVSDNAVRKWCKSYNLPTKTSDIKSINSNDWINL